MPAGGVEAAAGVEEDVAAPAAGGVTAVAGPAVAVEDPAAPGALPGRVMPEVAQKSISETKSPAEAKAKPAPAHPVWKAVRRDED